ncbi:uncharacterized protein METZ01_LOCUS449482, partial [marine metagenome]
NHRSKWQKNREKEINQLGLIINT